MNSGWSTLYEIASKRHSTNNGKDHLTKNAFKVLEDFMLEEVNQSVRFSSGVVSWAK